MTLLVASTIKISLVLALGLALAAALHRRSAALRHWVLAVTLASAAAMPLLEQLVPGWRIDVGRTTAQPPQPSQIDSSRPASPAVQTTLGIAAVAAAPRARVDRASIEALARGVWLGGVAVSLFVLLCGLARLRWLAGRSLRLTDGRWSRIADEIGAEQRLPRQVHVLQSTHPTLLLTWGVIQPRILIPRIAHDWAEPRVGIVLRHELAHIRRGDWIVQIAGELLRVAYWFNPLFWIVCARLRQASEQACDDEVLSGGVRGSDYASELLEIARALKAQRPFSLPALAIARSSDLERRIHAMLDAHRTRTPVTRLIRFGAAAAVVVFAVGVAAAQKGPVTLTGSVRDATGAAVPGATVTLTSAQSQAKFEVKSDSAGQFTFVPLPADQYGFAVALPGFEAVAEQLQLAGSSMRREVTLALGSLSETVSVSGMQRLEMHNGVAASGPGQVLTFRRLDVEVGPNDTQTVIGNSDRTAFERDLAICTASSEGGRVRPPRKIKDVRPSYPAELREAGTGGTVVVKATFGTDGRFRDGQIVKSAHAELDNAAFDAIRQWQFDGLLLNCAPMDFDITATVSFSTK